VTTDAAELRSEPNLPLPVSLAFATWALFVGLALLLVGVGLFATVVSVASDLNGYGTGVIGAIAAAYYGGFLLGSRLTLLALARVGHIRVYAALASVLSATMITVGLTDSPVVWILIRLVSGLCIGGQYVVAESWLNHLASNTNRGRLLGIYLVVTSGAYGIGQLLIGTVDPARVTGFAIAGLFTSLAVVPVALSEDARPPSIQRSEPIGLRDLARVVPTGVGSGFLVGLTHGALVSLSAVYGSRAGLSNAEIGPFVAVTSLGGVLLQWPISSASDQLDRRFVGVVAASGAIAASVLLLAAGPEGWTGLAAMTLIGGLSLPLYSVAAAYTNDWVEPERISAAASQLVVLYGAGAFVGPLAAAAVMAGIGNDGYVVALIGMHAAIVVFLIYRMFAWRAPITRTAWVDATLSARAFFIPANVVWMGRRLGTRGRRAIRARR
jgi:MFS family permease